MRQFIIASHAHFAAGINESVSLLSGERDNVRTLSMYVDGNNDLAAAAAKMLDETPEGDDLVVCTDLFGGSVNNEFMAALAENDFTLICGMNMPLLVEILSDANPGPAAVRAAVDSCKDTIMICNDLLDDGQDCGEDF